MEKQNLEILFNRFLNDECSNEEIAYLINELSADVNNPLLQRLIRDQLEKQPNIEIEDAPVDEVYNRIAHPLKSTFLPATAPVSGSSVFYKKMALAASISLLLFMAAYWLFFDHGNTKAVPEEKTLVATPKDFSPGGNIAILTLANGSTIVLDSTQNGMVRDEGGVDIIKQDDGHLVYKGNGTDREILYNSISTPRGGQYQITLADGTRAWLNAAASLRFPTDFLGKERKVEITGEVYFEVARNPLMPFIVKAGDAEVKVIGTHFNINAYKDEADIKVTLKEGAVQVLQAKAGQPELLKPGQQAQINNETGITILSDIDVEQVLAWRYGLFDFSNADIKTIMRQIGRWYDIDVVYEGQLTERKFFGKISRNTTTTTVLKILEQSDIHFRTEDKKIIVIP